MLDIKIAWRSWVISIIGQDVTGDFGERKCTVTAFEATLCGRRPTNGSKLVELPHDDDCVLGAAPASVTTLQVTRLQQK